MRKSVEVMQEACRVRGGSIRGLLVHKNRVHCEVRSDFEPKFGRDGDTAENIFWRWRLRVWSNVPMSTRKYVVSCNDVVPVPLFSDAIFFS